MGEWEQKNAARRAAVLALPTVHAWHHARIVPPQQGDVRISESIGPLGELLAVWTAPADRAVKLPEVRASRPVRVTVHVPEMAVAARIPDFRLAHPRVQPLPDGRVLMVDARCTWRSEGPDRNAIVYDSDGEAVAEQTFGDGIDYVQTTRNGEIWVGYFDEGTEWPVVRIHDGGVTGWRNEIRSATALAVRGSRLAFYGGYPVYRDRLVAGVLDDDRFRVTGEYRLVLPDGQEMPREARVFGRGADLHVVTRDDWYRLGLEDLPG